MSQPLLTNAHVAHARGLAVQAHADQMYGDQPYCYHLDAVAALVSEWAPEVRVWAYLHDVLEDVPTSVNDGQYWRTRISTLFGERILKGCELLRDEPGLNRKARKAATHAKHAAIKAEFSQVLIVKIADRLANLRYCVALGDSKRLKMYCSEHAAFRDAVYRRDLAINLQDELDRLIRDQS